LARLGFHPDLTTMPFDDLAANGKANPGTCKFGLAV
jgi:hypothetical protein